MREIFRRTGHLLPDSAVMAKRSILGMTLTAVFAPGAFAVGGGEDIAKALQVVTEAVGAKWVVEAATTTHTIIILTGALLASPALAKQVFPFDSCPSPLHREHVIAQYLQVSSVLTHKRFLFLYSEAHGWDFADPNRSVTHFPEPKP